jgi:trehalose-phosphatase
MENYWRAWPRIKSALAEKRRLLLITDFDGTLSSYVSHPRLARLAPQSRSSLERLSRMSHVSVAVISGRALADIQSRVGIPGLYYGGNHGLELEGPDLEFIHPKAVQCRNAIELVARKAREHLVGVPGAMVEDKSFSLSIHYRRVPAAAMSLFHKGIKRLKTFARNLPVAWRPGHKIWEAVPRVAWHKGRAAQYLRRHLGQPWPVLLGDDRTDEDMFRAFPKTGWTIRVGHSDHSSARLHLMNQKDVQKFLTALIETMAGPA